MSLVNSRIFSYPDMWNSNQWWVNSSLFSSASQAILNSTTNQQALICISATSGFVSSVGIRINGVNDNSQIIRVGLQSVNISGNPSNVFLNNNSASGGIYPTGIFANTWYDVPLVSGVNVPVGTKLAITAEWIGPQSTGVITSVSNANVSYLSFPYYVNSVSGTWQNKRSSAWSVALSYNGTYANINNTPCLALANQTFNHNTTLDTVNDNGNEVGNFINLPFKCRSIGAYFVGSTAASADTFNVNLYDSTGSGLLTTYIYNANEVGSTTIPRQIYWSGGPVNLVAGSSYYVSLAPTGLGNVILYGNSVALSGQFEAWPGGSGIYECYRAAPSGWNYNTNKRMAIGLLLDQVDDGANVINNTTGGGAVSAFSSPFINWVQI